MCFTRAVRMGKQSAMMHTDKSFIFVLWFANVGSMSSAFLQEVRMDPDFLRLTEKVPSLECLWQLHSFLVIPFWFGELRIKLKRVVRNAQCMLVACRKPVVFISVMLSLENVWQLCTDLPRLVAFQQMLGAAVYQGLGAAQIWRWLRGLWPCSGRVVAGLWMIFSRTVGSHELLLALPFHYYIDFLCLVQLRSFEYFR